MNRQKLFRLSVTLASYKSIVNAIISNSANHHSNYVCIANVHMLVEAYTNNHFASIVNNASLVTADGLPLTWALRLLYSIKQDRVSGMDLLPDLISAAEKEAIPVYFYGSSDEMLSNTRKYLSSHHPDLQIAGLYSPPFRPLTPGEEETVISEINQSGARIVFVVLGCPKQEKWMASMQGKINATMIGVGGALPVMIGMQERAPLWMQQFGCEWLFRFMQEPRRLWKRYLVTNSLFIYLLIKEKIKLEFINPG